MKVRVVMLTENDAPVPKVDNLNEQATLAWELFCKVLSDISGDKITIEKVEVLDDTLTM